MKNTMVRHSLQTPDDKSHVIDTNLSVTFDDTCVLTFTRTFCGMLVNTNVI